MTGMEPIAHALRIVLPYVAVVTFILLNAAYLVYAERKILGHMQARLGPMVVGWHGLLQPIADGVKLIFKEDIVPAKADKAVFAVAPLIILTTAVGAFATVPFGPERWLTNLNVGILYILALASVGTYGVIMAGWASNNKYSLLGGLRSAAQMISYEVPMAFAIVTVVLMAGSLNLAEIVNAQANRWFFFTPVGPVVFFLYLVAGVAETNRTPFDLPEAETELVAGFFTEYSGMRWAMFFVGEYANMIMVSLLVSILFLGGWMPLQIFPHALGTVTVVTWINAALRAVPSLVWLLGKMYFFLFFYMWIRATLPRLRYDQLMAFSWKVMLPLSLGMLLLTAFLKHRGWM